MERESKYNYYVSSNNDNSYSNHFIYSKKNNFPTTVTEIVESREQNTLPISAIMPNIKNFIFLLWMMMHKTMIIMMI